MNLRFSFLLGSVLCLSGCEHYFMKPSIIPVGYTNTHKEYKAIDGPEASDIGYDYTASKNERVLMMWRDRVGLLVQELEERVEITPKAVYVAQPKEHSPQNATYDFVLREELMRLGYVIARHPDEAVALHYNVEKIDEEWIEFPYPNLETRRYNEDYNYVDNGWEFMRLSLALLEDKTELFKLERELRVPTYGYQHEFDHQKFFRPIKGQRHPVEPKSLMEQDFFQYNKRKMTEEN